MKAFSLIILMVILTSCASSNRYHTVSEAPRDGLRFESLNRYDFNRLSNSKYSEKPIALCHKKEYNQAYKIFKQQLDQQKENPTYWNHLATCNLLEKKYSRAKFYYDIALNLAPKKSKIKATIMNNLGLYFLQLKRPYLAKDFFEKAMTIYPKYKTPKYNIAQIYLKFSQFNKAQKLLTELYNSSNKDIDFIYGLGHLYLMQGQYQKAQKYFSLIPAKYLSRDDIATNYALNLYFLGQSDKAYKVVKNAQMKDSHYLFAQTELIKKIERQNQ
jgi:tetratricopeptide (TPR) repeat protein